MPPGVELVTPFTSRNITHAFHDIDGTHSLIRDWVPVMTLVTGFVSKYGMPEKVPKSLAEIISTHKPTEFPEARRFAIESAGLSALTQMEWALRNAANDGVIILAEFSKSVNREIVSRIWKGEELFHTSGESQRFQETLSHLATILFKAYEILLKTMCRDRNLAAARENPSVWMVPGSKEFLKYLCSCGVKNYFVTGAVVERNTQGIPSGTMYEEITALGYEIGKNKIISDLYGSSWCEKLPKQEIMQRICIQEKINPSQVLIVGDGRSEIAAGVAMGAITISRLDSKAVRTRAIHRQLKTNIIVENYDMKNIKQIWNFS